MSFSKKYIRINFGNLPLYNRGETGSCLLSRLRDHSSNESSSHFLCFSCFVGANRGPHSSFAMRFSYNSKMANLVWTYKIEKILGEGEIILCTYRSRSFNRAFSFLYYILFLLWIYLLYRLTSLEVLHIVEINVTMHHMS